MNAISLLEFSSNINPILSVIAAFSNPSSAAGTENHLMHCQVENAVFNFLRRRAGRGLSTNKLNPRQANYRETRTSRVRHEIFIRHTKDNFDIRTEVAPSRLVTEIDSSKAGIILSTILYLDHQV